ncbi:Ltp family lipoprotein [Brachybacterium squillarum]|uniref:Ltp family lipoprotein n=1 Tax=Brachybacterium squillarum TaxID=661979 RepID=UPI00222330D3|nr:Ltp family lipoprotein [Brachybacterium squillarum]MCW1804365.1 Ltp family lipoprotein [Brachybacterium squillarum]
MGTVKRGVVRAWGALLATAAVVGTGMAVQAPALADGREVGGSGSAYFLNDSWSSKANHEFSYGKASDRVYTGDWNGDGKDSLAVRRGQTYYFSNSLGGSASTVVNYGKATDTVLVGDWDGDGKDTLAVRRGQTYYFTNSLSGGKATTVLNYGKATDTVLVGDWNGDGKDTLAVRRGQTYYFSNSLTGGKASSVINYGKASDKVLVGDWNADAKDTLAVRRGNVYYISNRLSGGAAAIVQAYGRATDTTLAGDWNGDRKDTLGVRRVAEASGPTAAQRNAIAAARDYLANGYYSRSGLISELEYAGTKAADAEYAVDHLASKGEVDWDEQALETAYFYLEGMAFSRDMLRDFLRQDGFTVSQAESALTNLEDSGDIDWREEAVAAAHEYYDEDPSWTRDELVAQLVDEGFPVDDANYAADELGL